MQEAAAMNGEIPSVPIITLGGITSLTNLLPELPLPSPLPHTVGNKSLLFHPRVAVETQQLLSCRPDTAVAMQLVTALRKTNTDHIELKDGLPGEVRDDEAVPDLLRVLLAQDPDVFKGSQPLFCGANNVGYGIAQHNAIYPTGSVRPTESMYSALQGYPPTANGALEQFQQQAVGGGYPPTHHHIPAEYSYLMNGGSPSLQSREIPAYTAGTNKSPTKSLIADSSPAQASAAPASDLAYKGLPTAAQYSYYGQQLPPATDTPMSASLQRKLARHDDVHLASEPRVLLQPLDMQHMQFGTPTNSGANFSMSAQKKLPRQPDVSVEPRVLLPQIDIEAARKHSAPKSNTLKVTSDMAPTVSLVRIDNDLLRDKKRHRHDSDRYNVISSAESDHKLTLKLSKAKLNDSRRGTKRQLSDDECDDDDYIPEGSHMTMKQMQEMYGEFAASLTERVKRRRRQVSSYRDDGSDDMPTPPDRGAFSAARRRDVVDDDSCSNSSYTEAMRKKKKERKQRRGVDSTATIEELMEMPTFKRFNAALDAILDAAEDVDLTELKDDDDDLVAGGGSESLITKTQISDLCSEAAKLKSMGVMNQVPYEKLIKVLTILQYSIKEGCKIIPALDPDGENEEEQYWRELTLERVLSAVDAALTAMYVMTSVDMPKEVFIEDVIERVVRMTKTQLHNAIYPEFDPVYRIDPHNKSGFQSNMKMKRSKASGSKDRTTLALYNKLTDLTSLLAELIEIQELTDTIILQTSTLAVSPFFVENIKEMQLNALKLVTNLFCRYEKHRQLILEDILSSLARLPSSKKNLRSYRLNAEEYIQMVTALALQLIQCVVKLPRDDDQPPPEPEEDDVKNKKKQKNDQVDKEVMILTSYETAMRTAHNFLAVFLAKCTSKGEDDYRPLFENFVYDLLATVNKPEWPAAELILSLLGNLLVRQFSCKSVEMSLRVASLDYLGIVAARLRRDAVSSHLNEGIIDDIIAQINENDAEVNAESDTKPPKVKQNNDGCDRTQHLQRALLEYLVYSSENDPALIFARQFYIAQWHRDCTMEVEKAAKKLTDGGVKTTPDKTAARPKKKKVPTATLR